VLGFFLGISDPAKTLVGRALLDVPVAVLTVIILAAGNFIFDIDFGITARSFWTSLLGWNKGHFAHGVAPL
jgi:hypothetical protein